jgi:hypothetical protein
LLGASGEVLGIDASSSGAGDAEGEGIQDEADRRGPALGAVRVPGAAKREPEGIEELETSGSGDAESEERSGAAGVVVEGEEVEGVKSSESESESSESEVEPEERLNVGREPEALVSFPPASGIDLSGT